MLLNIKEKISATEGRAMSKRFAIDSRLRQPLPNSLRPVLLLVCTSKLNLPVFLPLLSLVTALNDWIKPAHFSCCKRLSKGPGSGWWHLTMLPKYKVHSYRSTVALTGTRSPKGYPRRLQEERPSALGFDQHLLWDKCPCCSLPMLIIYVS